MATPTVYVICDQNCKFESMTKEQILTAITQAVNEGKIGDIDGGFITTVKTINGTPLRFFVGEQAEYDALPDYDKINLFAIITNDITKENLFDAIARAEEYSLNAQTIAEEKALYVDEQMIAFNDLFSAQDAAIGAVRTKANNNASKLAASFPAPSVNSAKRLTSAGYYFISARASGFYNFGLIYWDGASTVNTPYTALDNSYIYELRISAAGAITIVMDAGKGESDMTAEFSIYTAKVWG